MSVPWNNIIQSKWMVFVGSMGLYVKQKEPHIASENDHWI